MAVLHSTTSPIPVSLQARSVPSPQVQQHRRRRIGYEAGRALEILGHAIEYLADEIVHDSATHSIRNAQVEAVQLLMDMNRNVYFECPEAPTLADRWQSFLHSHNLTRPSAIPENHC